MLEQKYDIDLTQCKSGLTDFGHCFINLSKYISPLKTLIKNEKWEALDEFFKKELSSGAPIFKLLSHFESIKSIEHIIAIRDSNNEWEEDGIWHDDGSRPLAFTLSLTNEMIKGGELNFRKKKGNDLEIIPTQPYGTLLVFKTGTSDYEHKVNAVTKGKRIIIAGWCT